jgi:hypothetical protein
MARHKIPADPRGGHIRLYWELVDSVAWRALSWAERGLYLAMRRKLLGSNNGNIEATLATLRHAGITSSATLAKGLRALMTAGFIDKTRQGGVAYGAKVCSLYRFTDESMADFPKLGLKARPATNEWRSFARIAEVRAAIRQAHEAARRPTDPDRAKVHRAKRTSARSEWKASVSDSIPEEEAAALIHRVKQAQRA